MIPSSKRAYDNTDLVDGGVTGKVSRVGVLKSSSHESFHSPNVGVAAARSTDRRAAGGTGRHAEATARRRRKADRRAHCSKVGKGGADAGSWSAQETGIGRGAVEGTREKVSRAKQFR